MKGVLRGLRERAARTDPGSEDPRLAGRTYAIPFDDVWRASVTLAGGKLGGWRVVSADDQAGVIEASAKSLLLRSVSDVQIEVGLDENGQTRVDVSSTSRKSRGDLGRNRRVIGRFVRRLDRSLGADPAKILDPTRVPAWIESR